MNGMNRQIDGQVDILMDGWMDGWMDDAWIDRHGKGWLDR